MSDAPELRRAVKAYLDAISRISRVGTPELSHYTALDNLFDAIGDQLKPKVRAVVHHSEAGGDQPDLGFFAAAAKEPLSGSPDRGVVEVKGSEADLDHLIASEQVAKYWRTHKLVLVTNLRQFALVGENSSGTKTTLERCALAETDDQFEELLKHTTRAANRHGVSLGEYLARVMEHTAAISEPRDLARLLASYARDALQRVERAVAEEDSLQPIREALEQALGMRFEDERAEEFFRSTLVQTLFYGVFAAWVLWARAGKSGRFRWKDTVDYLRAPVLRMLFHQLTDPGRLERLELVDVLDWTEAALERVDRDEFLKRFSQGEAVQYFYEPFLEAFDPALRKQLGVWYTPREVVRYMVARVDRALRDDLGIAQGLADKRVYVLDPCCGTGAFLVETLRRIAETEQAAGLGALAAASVREAAATRVFGFEIMPAPLVVAHLEVGLALEQLGAGLGDDERVGVFLTNALTGWEPHTTKPLPFPELEQERKDANAVKQDQPILVVLGNPPYNGFAGVAVEEERELSRAYRSVQGGDVPKPQGQGLNDLYVRFYRMAERRIADRTGQGVVCFISNYSWLDGLSFPGMRQRYLDAFDIVRIDSLNGDKYRTGKLTPDGHPTPASSPRPTTRSASRSARRSRRWCARTRTRARNRSVGASCGASASCKSWRNRRNRSCRRSTNQSPDARSRPALRKPVAVSDDWFDWPSLVDLFPAHFPGVKTNRDAFLMVDIRQDKLQARIADYFDSDLSHEETP